MGKAGGRATLGYASDSLRRALALSPIAKTCVGISFSFDSTTIIPDFATPPLASNRCEELTVHVHIPQRLSAQYNDIVPAQLPFLFGGKTIWDFTANDCDSDDWVQMAATPVILAIQNILHVRKHHGGAHSDKPSALRHHC